MSANPGDKGVEQEEDKKEAARSRRGKSSKVRLLDHEQALLRAGKLSDVTHAGASALWLSTDSTVLSEAQRAHRAVVYRHMGDKEFAYLLQNNELPDTQPYQTIVEGPRGRAYCEKYLRGAKWVDSQPTTIVEFELPRTLVDKLFEMQHKPEDGCMSMGLGSKAGGGLPLFNSALSSGQGSWRVVMVKRSDAKQGKGKGNFVRAKAKP